MDPSGHRLPGPAGDPSFTVRLPAVPATLTAVRRRLRAWLDRIGWPLDEQGAVLLTTSEACSNAVEHAYRDRPVGDVQVTATVLADGDERCLVVEVRDRGRWRGRTAADTPGHGLRLMRACLQSCTVRTQEGTVVTLTSRTVPAPTAPGPTGAVPTATLPTATLPAVAVSAVLGPGSSVGAALADTASAIGTPPRAPGLDVPPLRLPPRVAARHAGPGAAPARRRRPDPAPGSHPASRRAAELVAAAAETGSRAEAAGRRAAHLQEAGRRLAARAQLLIDTGRRPPPVGSPDRSTA